MALTFSGHLLKQIPPLESIAAHTIIFCGWATVPIEYLALYLFAVFGIHALILPPTRV